MIYSLSINEKLGGIAFGAAALALGKDRIETAKSIWDLVVGGSRLSAEISEFGSDDFVKQLEKRAIEVIEQAKSSFDWKADELSRAEADLADALPACVPTHDLAAAVGLNAEKMTNFLLQSLIEKNRRFEVYSFASPSLRLFELTVCPMIRVILNDKNFVEAASPALWAKIFEKEEENVEAHARTHAMLQKVLEGHADAVSEAVRPYQRALDNIIRAAFENTKEGDSASPETLEKEVVQRFNNLVDRIDAFERRPNHEAAFQTERARIAALFREGRSEEAEKAVSELNVARWHQLTAQRAEMAVDEDRAARSAKDEFRYQTAASHWANAATYAADDATQQWGYLRLSASALINHGREFGERESIQKAALLLTEQAIPLVNPDDCPDAWAVLHNSLGNAWQALGEQSNDINHIKDAIVAYEVALQIRNRARSPLDWAMVQTNFGNALASMGLNIGDPSYTERAIVALQSALDEREPDTFGWALTQNNLGNTIAIHGENVCDSTFLKKAVAAFQEALKVWTEEQFPWDWAMVQNNLGNTLRAFGELENDSDSIKNAIFCCQQALSKRTKDRAPVLWAQSQHNLTGALILLGEIEQKGEILLDAINRAAKVVNFFEESGMEHHREISAKRLETAQQLLTNLPPRAHPFPPN